MEKTTLLKTLLEAAEKAVFFIVVVFKASSLKEEEEEEDKEVDEIAWGFMFALCACLFSVFWRKKKNFFLWLSKNFKKKKAREIFTREDLSLEQKSIKRTRAFFFLARERNQISSQSKSGALVRR